MICIFPKMFAIIFAWSIGLIAERNIFRNIVIIFMMRQICSYATPTIPANSRTTWINDFQCSHACVRLSICYADIRYNESFYLLLCSSMCVFHSTVFNVDREIECYREYVQCRVYLRRHQKERIRNQNIKCVCSSLFNCVIWIWFCCG